ncbi:unnamed protein product [Cyprideis torosa]|uniref:Uncharacterized protein n=1 Tax=Cyprideis torosa TaxID=163714 RepID=A0A7R8ZGQ0_9CRUS|nr:unnamed protein product [Cyprideis torosa]CAG0880726.1 unnamed protein product [Cyprideis torosa]
MDRVTTHYLKGKRDQSNKDEEAAGDAAEGDVTPFLSVRMGAQPNRRIPIETSEVVTRRSAEAVHSSASTGVPRNLKPNRRRRKRSISQEYFIELLVVADPEMQKYHGDSLKDYILTLMSVVALIFRDASIGNSVNIAVVRIMVIQDPEELYQSRKPSWYYTVNQIPHENDDGSRSASDMLRSFCYWQSLQNEADDSHPSHHDSALLLTRANICRNPSLHKCDTLGLAELGTMCNRHASCAIVQDNGLSAAFTIAHELGHVLNMPHDDDYKCHKWKPKTESASHKVMSRMLDHNTYPWAWSNCSRHFLTEYLDAGYGHCLTDHPEANYLALERGVKPSPGENFSVNKQCQLVFGEEAKICSYMVLLLKVEEVYNVSRLPLNQKKREGGFREASSLPHFRFDTENLVTDGSSKEIDFSQFIFRETPFWFFSAWFYPTTSALRFPQLFKRPRDPLRPPCRRLWCATGEHGELDGCRTQHMPWADGTPCKSDSWCQRGECVPKQKDVTPVDGKWGKWQDWGPCSRSCGGGVQKSVRHCDSPTPSAGGRYCTGRRVRYRSCQTEDCEDDGDFRASQCKVYDGQHFNIHGLSSSVKWDPKYDGIQAKDYCKLFCQVQNSSAYYLLQDKVVDGTPCTKESTDICVSGICRPAGCDHVLDSDKKTDICGVCGGRNTTCRVIEGHYNEINYGYNHVMLLPAGATNIDIRQHGRGGKDGHGGKDENYLALIDVESRKYILNGHFIVSPYQKSITYEGVTLDYSGAEAIVERLNSSSKPLKKDLIVEARKRYQKVVCVSLPDRNPVPDEKCDPSQKPEITSEPCQTHCQLKWKLTHRSECSSLCGPGVRKVTVQCLQEINDFQDVPLHDKYCDEINQKKPPDSEPCEGQCLHSHWQYGEWSECSQSCNGGQKTRKAICVDDLGREVDVSQCNESEAITLAACGKGNCPHWQVEEWTPCSYHDGACQRLRGLWCQLGGRNIPQRFCDKKLKPMFRELCPKSNCAIWESGNWGGCSTTCGEGVRLRSVRCRNLDGGVVEDSLCEAGLKPATSENCNRGTCPASVADNVPTDPDIVVPPSIHDVNSKTPKDLGPRYGLNDLDVKTADWKLSEWGPCSVTCGQGYRNRTVACFTASGLEVESAYCAMKRPSDAYLEPCTMPPCGKWIYGNWSQCSVTCGQVCQTGQRVVDVTKIASTTGNYRGYELRQVACVSSNSEVLDNSSCSGQKRPVSERICRQEQSCRYSDQQIVAEAHNDPVGGEPPGPQWILGPWGECSKTCGGGFKLRQVVCRDSGGKESQACSVTKKPRETIHCNTDPCPIWNSGEWSACSKTCGGGFQRRQVRCQDHLGRSLPAHNCDGENRLEDVRFCAEEECPTEVEKQYTWRKSKWSEVKSAPSLAQSPPSHARSAPSHARSAPSLARSAPSLARSTPSLAQSPPSHARSATSLARSAPSVARSAPPLLGRPSLLLDRGRGKREGGAAKRAIAESRLAVCGVLIRQNQLLKSTSGIVKRILREKCRKLVNGVFSKFVLTHGKHRNGHTIPVNSAGLGAIWFLIFISQCSHTCGFGVKHRRVSCHRVNQYGWVDPDPVTHGCNITQKPAELRSCILGQCEAPYYWKVGRWKEALRTDVDQEYPLIIGFKNISIYCHHMNTPTPVEYVSLTGKEMDNYAEIYSKRLRKPNTCPRDGDRFEECDCVDDVRKRAGLTLFYKVRLNVTSLRIHRHDFTFTRRVHGRLIPFAEAGDCYSTANCPQGRFSINLSGTGLRVAPHTTWVGKGSKASQRIHRLEDHQRIQGRCGGYCGTCTPDLQMGLKLDVMPP